MNYKNPQYLVETDWLEAHLDQAGLRVFDVTGMLTAKLENVAEERHYDQGHIPGAIFFDVASAKGELSDPANDLPWMWPTQVHFEQVMSCYGVTQESHVVLYAATPRPNIDNGMMWCTRAWWTMHHLGVRCSILNGGWERWVTEERPVSTETATWSAASFKASGDGRSAVADKNAVLAATETPDQVRIVDALATSSFAGEGKALYGPRKGHITGAVSVPMSALIDEKTGRFADAETLTRHFEEVGVLSAERVITYCGGGIAATTDAFALALLGYTDVSVYDASLFEWSADPALPMTDPSQG